MSSITTGNNQVAIIGEVMVELAPYALEAERDLFRVDVAGDTFNTAVTLARLGGSVSYVTQLGDDELSDRVMEVMSYEGIRDQFALQVPGRQPGLYMISNSSKGERSFRYWRNESPARELFDKVENFSKFSDRLEGFQWIYVSGISLAILNPEGRDNLINLLQTFHQQGGRVVFDSNYRARLWRNSEYARTTLSRIIEICDVALVTIEDEQALWGDIDTAEILDRYNRLGVGEVAIKQGPDPVIIYHQDTVERIPVDIVCDVVDTTGAGDAFNGGYLAGRLKGLSPRESAALGSKAAAAVIRRPGGIVARDYFLQQLS